MGKIGFRDRRIETFGSFYRDAFWYNWEAFNQCFQRFQIRFVIYQHIEGADYSRMFDWNMGLQTNSLLEM